MSPRVSPSKLDLAERCSYPWTSGLPHDAYVETESAERGKMVHAYLAARALGEKPAPLDDEELERAADNGAALLDADLAAGATVLYVETTVALDLATGRGRIVTDRREHARPGELRGTVDLALRAADGSLVVRDWKTGRRGDVGAETLQLAAYALALASVHRAPAVRVELVHLLDGYEGTVDSCVYDAIDLGAALARIRAVARPPHDAEPRPGSHCRSLYCPIAQRCPATLALVERARAACALPDTTTLDPPTAVRVLERLPLVDAYLAALRHEAESVVAAAGVTVADDGRGWGVIERDGDEAIVADVAAPVLEQLGLADAIEQKTTATKASLERAARRRATKRGELSATMRTALEALRAAGAITRGAPYRRVGPIT